MPDTSLIMTIVAAVFSAGVTWGIMSSKQRQMSTKIDSAIADLRGVVSELKSLATDVKVMSALSVRVENQLNQQSEKLSKLEADVAKLQALAA